MARPKSQPAIPPPADRLSLHAVCKLFGQDPRTIKARADRGDFDMTVEDGRYWITRESIDRHMKELQERHARRG